MRSQAAAPRRHVSMAHAYERYALRHAAPRWHMPALAPSLCLSGESNVLFLEVLLKPLHY
eukprot:COSAG06_NODE_17751_length_923_cov_1.216019_1_plen_59_part_01